MPEMVLGVRSSAWSKGRTLGWLSLSRVVTVPPGAGFLVLLPGAGDQQPDDVCRHDDLRMVRLP